MLNGVCNGNGTRTDSPAQREPSMPAEDQLQGEAGRGVEMESEFIKTMSFPSSEPSPPPGSKTQAFQGSAPK